MPPAQRQGRHHDPRLPGARPPGAHSSAAHSSGARLSRPLHRWTLALLGALWLSGAAWMVLRYFFGVSGEWGWQPHPLQSWALRAHGILALMSMVLLGWLGASHMVRAWRHRPLRVSGLVLAAGAVLLLISGDLLFYLSGEAGHRIASLMHQTLGLLALGAALVHCRRIV